MNDINIMESSSIKPNNDDFIMSWKRANEKIASFYVVVIIAIFPLFFWNYYFDILVAKYRFYICSVISMFLVVLVVAAVYIIKDYKYSEGQHIRNILAGCSIRMINTVDWMMMLFLISAVISTFQSEYFYESFWGNEGRYCGLFLIILYAVSFFIISKCLVLKRWHLDAFLAAGMIACIIGILQYFNFDIIGFKRGIVEADFDAFASTFGNINTYTSYVALVSGISTVLFCIEKTRNRQVWYLICVVVSIFALITGISDNAYLALFALMGLLPLYLFGQPGGISKYILILSILLTEFQAIGWMTNKLSAHVIGINGLFNVIVEYAGLGYIVALLWGIYIVLYLSDVVGREKKRARISKCIARRGWLIFLIIVAGCLVFALYDVNFLGNSSRYGGLSGYLLMNDTWGTNRGYIWKLVARIYDNFPLMNKLFGYGPDTFGIITVSSYLEEMIAQCGQKFDSAHNEYLQYLITIGGVGLLTYVGFLITSLIRMIRLAKQNNLIMAIVFAVICYCVQAVVNISVPMVMPIVMLLIMMGIAAGREECGVS